MEKLTTSQLSGIPETMLITLWSKAIENERTDAILKDKKASEIISKIDYDFGKFKNIKLSQVGVCVRANLIDNEAKEFLQKYPDGVVIQLGAGLDAPNAWEVPRHLHIGTILICPK